MKKTEVLSQLLFASAKGTEIGISRRDASGRKLLTGMQASFGTCLSPARDASATGNAKVNIGAWVLDMLFNSKIAALANDDGSTAYVELVSGNVYRAKVTNESISCDIEFPGMSLAVPFVIRALSDEANFHHTREVFTEIRNEVLSTGDARHALIFKFCDSLYYEWKKIVNDIDEDKDLKIKQIEQAVRTEELQAIDIFDGIPMAKLSIKADVAKKSAEESKTAQRDQEKFESCKAGAYILDHCWEGERRKYIPGLSNLNQFVPSESFFTMVDLISGELGQVLKRMKEDFLVDYQAIGDNYVNAQFVGRPGTGKTTIADALGAAFGMPVRVVINSKNTEEDTFQGMTKVQEGGFKFVETPFLDVYKNGGILLLEEFNLADPGVMMGALGQAIEKPFILLEDGYKEVRRHPMCVVIATMNTGTQGSREPSEALTSRMPHVFLLDDPEEGQFLEILEKKSGAKRTDCKKVYEAYNKIINYLVSGKINAEDVALSITLRHCLATLKQMSIGRTFKQAIRNTLIGTIAIKDVNLSKNVYDNVIEHLKD